MMSVAHSPTAVRTPLEAPTSRVVDAMVTIVKTLGRHATFDDLVAHFEDDHVHMAVVVQDDKVLTAIDRDDFVSADRPRTQERIVDVGTLTGRWVGPLEDLAQVHERMIRTGRRRLVVLDEAGRFLGLLCLKSHGQGFCGNQDVMSRHASSAR